MSTADAGSGVGRASPAPIANSDPRVVDGHTAARRTDTVWSAETRAWLLAVICFALGTVWPSRVMSVDSFYDLYVGRYILAHGVPHQNVATLAASGQPWIDQQWLAHLAYYAAWRAGGYPVVAMVSAVAETAGFALVALLMQRRGVAPSRMFAWTAGAVVVCLASYQVEAQSFAYPLFVLTLWLLADDADASRPRRRTWLLIPVLVVWANLHGSALLGAGLTACYSAYRAVRALTDRDYRSFGAYVLLAAGAVTAVSCTPYGTAVFQYYRHVVGDPVVAQFVSRWAPPSPGDPATWVFAALAIAVFAAVIAAWRHGARPNRVLAAACVVLLVLALTAARDADWFAIAGVLLAADSLARSSGGRKPAVSAWFARAVAALFVAAAATGLATLAAVPPRQFETLVPDGAVKAGAAIATRHPTWRILGDAYTGTALLWLAPGTFGRVGFDVRFEQYSRSELAAYFDYIFVRGPDWARVTRGYQILTIARKDDRLVAAMRRLHGWCLAYSDGTGVVFVRVVRPESGCPARVRLPGPTRR